MLNKFFPKIAPFMGQSGKIRYIQAGQR